MRLNSTVRQPALPSPSDLASPKGTLRPAASKRGARGPAAWKRGAPVTGVALLAAGVALSLGLDGATGADSDRSGSAVCARATLQPGTALQAQEYDLVVDGDVDGDGLSDTQEQVLETFAHVADTDGDGYSDTEELARHSDPLVANSVPQTTQPSAGLTARGEDGFLRLVMCVHEPAQQRGDALIRLGVAAGGNVYPVPIDRLALSGTMTFADGSAGSSITCLDVPIDPAFVHAHGFVSFFVASGSRSGQVLESAGKIDVFSDGQTLYLQSTTSPTLSRQQTGQGGATIRRPIPVVVGPPPESNWVAGSVCFQRSQVVGVNGARLLHQIVEADCVDGWDTFCSGDCSSAVGDTYETIDPWALIGG